MSKTKHDVSRIVRSARNLRDFSRSSDVGLSEEWKALDEALNDLDSKAELLTYEEYSKHSEYNPRLSGEAAKAAQKDPSKPEGACCNNEQRGMNGGCANCGDPCL